MWPSFGEIHVSSIVAGIWNATTPLLTMLVVVAVLPEVRLTSGRAVGLLIVLLGVASAATAMGQSLAGVTFHGAVEPLTPHRRHLLEAVGASVVVDYSSNELPLIASGCPLGTLPDDVHLMLNVYAVAERARALFDGRPSVDALLFTTLAPSATKIGINVEIGDAARIEELRVLL